MGDDGGDRLRAFGSETDGCDERREFGGEAGDPSPIAGIVVELGEDVEDDVV